GAGARLGQDSGVRDAGFIVAVDVGHTETAGADALIRVATGIDRAWLAPTSTSVEHELATSGVVRAWRIERYDAIELTRRPVAPDPDTAAELIASELVRRGPDDATRQLIQRLRFAGVPESFEALARLASAGATRLE